MARRPRASRIENRTSRLRLLIRRKPHSFTVVSPGISVGYRRNQGPGTWVLRVANGAGAHWTKAIGLADDYEKADGDNVLSWFEAIERARKVARGGDETGRPATVKDAVLSYQADLRARGGSIANATRILRHITPTISSKSLSLLTTAELSKWRDSLLAAGMKPATVVRLCKATKAAFTLAAKRDTRILNRAAWADGLSGISENMVSRNAQTLSDDEVRRVIAAAYELDPCFGVYVETAAVTGARLSQIAGLTISDLQADNGATTRLLMPTSRKGRGRKPGKTPVPITAELAAKLKTSRPAEEPLLLRSDGLAWQSTDDGDHGRLYAKAAKRAGVTGTIYALRHSSIVRSILAGVPLRVIAACCDTSTTMLERVYSAHIADFADAVARRGLLGTAADAKIVRLLGRRS